MAYARSLLKALTSRYGMPSAGLALLASVVFFLLRSELKYALLTISAYLLVSIGFAIACYFLYRYVKQNQQTIGTFLSRVHRAVLNRFRRLKSLDKLSWFRRQASESKLPCFILLGSKTSGKTTLLQESALFFSTASAQNNVEQEAFCWWFANDAVVMEATDNGIEDDTLGQSLKPLNAQRSLAGIIVTLSVDDLLNKEVRTLFQALRKHIESIYQYTGQRLPIHLVMTKMDVLTGFRDVFTNLDSKARQQACGFELNERERLKEHVQSKLEALSQSLLGRLFQQLHFQSDFSEKVDYLQFPQQFSRLTERLAEGIDAFSWESIYQEKPRLAGIYFTSAHAGKEDKSAFFIHDLLKHKLFAKKHATQFTLRKQKRLTISRGLQYTGLVSVTVAALCILASAYNTNASTIRHGKELASRGMHLFDSPQDLTQRLMYLDAVAQHVHNLRHFSTNQPWYYKFGLNRHKQLDVFDEILAKAMDKDFYKPVKHHLAQELIRIHKAWRIAGEKQRRQLRGQYYTDLKLYLMLNFPQHIDLNFASMALAHAWQQLRKEDGVQDEISLSALHELSATYLEYLSHLDTRFRKRLAIYSHEAIHLARHDLQTPSGVSNIYALIETQFNAVQDYFTYEQLFNDSGSDLWKSDNRLSSFYTRHGYQKLARPAFLKQAKYNVRKDWVIHASTSSLAKQGKADIRILNDEIQRRHFLNELNTQYFTAYFYAWNDFMASIKTVAFDSFEDATLKLRELANSNGSFLQLFKGLNQNLAIKNMMPNTEYSALPERLRHRFQGLEKLTSVHLDKNALLDRYLKQLTMLEQDIERLAIAPDPALTAEPYSRKLLNGEGGDTELFKTSLLVDQLTNEIDVLSTRQALKKVLLSPVQETYRALVHETVTGLQQTWVERVLKPYRLHLGGYFPFNRHGQDANLSEFSAFFRPKEGELAHFLSRLKPFVQEGGGQFRVKSWLDVPLPVSDSFLSTLSQLQKIGGALFPKGHGDLTLRYAIYPIPTPGLKEILFVSNNQSYPYRNGPQEWVSFIWPAQDSMDNETFIRITQTFDDLQAAKEFQGVWGLFHLLQSANHVTKTEKGYQLQWRFNRFGSKKTVKLLLSAKTQADPFDALLFHPIQLPERIML